MWLKIQFYNEEEINNHSCNEKKINLHFRILHFIKRTTAKLLMPVFEATEATCNA